MGERYILSHNRTVVCPTTAHMKTELSKFEFGLDKDNHLVLADEIFTPDSSCFWSLADYEVGTSPKKLLQAVYTRLANQQ